MSVSAINHPNARADNSPPLLPGATMAPNAVVVDPANDAHKMTWTKGQEVPIANGKQTPPPLAVPKDVNASAPTTFGGHWYAGSVYSGASTLNNWVLSEISVPSAAAPDTSQFYYVLTSIWDNAGSYDQIGFSDTFGHWGLTYSYTTGSCGSPSYVYNPDYFDLVPGQEYLLAMTTASGPGTWEEVYTVSSTGAISQIFALHAPTGASDPGLEQAAFYCGYYDYTDYEEVYGTTAYTQPDPYGAPANLEWYFHENCNGPTGCNTMTTWNAWKTSNAPMGTMATIAKYKTIPEIVIIQTTGQLKGFVPG